MRSIFVVVYGSCSVSDIVKSSDVFSSITVVVWVENVDNISDIIGCLDKLESSDSLGSSSSSDDNEVTIVVGVDVVTGVCIVVVVSVNGTEKMVGGPTLIFTKSQVTVDVGERVGCTSTG